MGRRNCKAQKKKQQSYSQRRQSDDDLVVVVIVFVTKFQVNCKILTKQNEKSTATKKKTKKCCAKAIFQKKNMWNKLSLTSTV